MKKLLSIILAIAMIVSFASCIRSSPKKDLDARLTALKSGDTRSVAMLNDEFFDEILQTDFALNVFSNLSWVIGDAVIVDDEAKVALQVTTTDVVEVYTEFMMQAMSDVFKDSNMSDEEISQILIGIMEESDYVKTFDVTVNMEEDDGKWVIDDDNNKEFLNAITGGLLSVAEDFA